MVDPHSGVDYTSRVRERSGKGRRRRRRRWTRKIEKEGGRGTILRIVSNTGIGGWRPRVVASKREVSLVNRIREVLIKDWLVDSRAKEPDLNEDNNFPASEKRERERVFSSSSSFSSSRNFIRLGKKNPPSLSLSRQ